MKKRKKAEQKRPKLSRQVMRRIADFRPKTKKPAFLSELDLPKNQKFAAFAPHADDLALSAGRTVFALARKPMGNEFHSFALMAGHRAEIRGVKSQRRRTAVRRLEASQEAKALGVKNHFMRLSFYETRLVSAKDVEKMCRQMAMLKPDVIFIPHSMDKAHPDHAYAHRLGLAVAKELVLQTGNPIQIWECESPWALISPAKINTYVLNSKKASKAQKKALKAHKSQMRRLPFNKINKADALKRKLLLGEMLAGFGRKPKKLLNSEAFVRYWIVRRGNKAVIKPV